MKNRFFSKTPFRLMHVVTSLCNARCKLCQQWKKKAEHVNDLNLDEIYAMLYNAKQAGMFVYTAWGGEPLIREDMHLILKRAKELDFVTSVITNGYYLKEKSDQLMPYTDSLVVSLDSHDDLHDEMRGLHGIKDRAIEGIKSCKKYKKKIVINSVICNLNVDKIEGLVELSKRLSVPINFQPMDIFEGYNDEYKLEEHELKNALKKIVELKRKGYNILNSYKYLEYAFNSKPFRCHAPKCYIPVNANGDIIHCINALNKKWGNVKKDKFKDIFKTKEFKNFLTESESCNICNDSCVIEISLAYSLNPFYLYERMVSNNSIV